MDGEDGELKVTNHPEKIGFTHDDGSRAKSSEATSHFDPKLSSREMRKIKYYEDMFAKMANENKGMTSETTNTQYTATPLQKPKSKVSERRRNADQKMEEGQANIGGYRPDSVDSTYGPTTTKSSRRSVYKKPAQATDTDYTGSKYINEASSSEYQYTDGKTLLDNKRLIRVQSMPMVTKKTKTTSYTDEKQHEEARSASARRPKVSRWDVKSSFAVPKTNRSPQVEPIAQEKPAVVDHKEEEEQDDTFSEGFGDMLIDEKEEQSTAETVEHTRERTGEYTETDQTEAYLENDARDLPLDVDDFLNEDLKEDGDLQEEEKEVIEEGEPGEEKEEDVEDQLEDPYMMEQEQAQAQPKKKSNRGRKAKKKQEAYAVDAEQEGRVGFAEDLTPLSAQPEYMEELKQPGRRSKSQRSRKKKQDIYDEKAFNKTKPAAKGSKSIARNHSGSSEKTEKAAVSINKREFVGKCKINLSKYVDVVEEKFISTENLRMITMEEAERMLNICTKKNTDYEDAKKFIDNLMISKIEHEKRLEERNPFLLDPSNIVAPTPVYDRPKPEPVPENPLQISFKYRLFQTLSKV
ncbi:conserved hypothetical protein [Theileria orientalis strain Shintoku]|uniref:Uncharacterized protein n=1 Tax=Theileria orientalis strain Shintoku TaxID=869250 RepID=J4C490_THEOR|nr:conserved hypothetical protein [Theileria orientalis strain Shintoku]BAM41771.1 conserved hypothetical protein [Theileria orientalis strain Shintoku]|eukprot:XP_009692072.1 conserved hypothetical protein [Theileria orientalis strain Shintoku]